MEPKTETQFDVGNHSCRKAPDPASQYASAVDSVIFAVDVTDLRV